MEKVIFEIREDELSEVNGGYHLTADDVKSLKPGETLILENALGENIAVVVYEGEWRDPGTFSMLQAKVRITKVFDSNGLKSIWDAFSNYKGKGDKPLVVGDVIYVSRFYLDFPERA